MRKELDVQGVKITLEVNGALPIIYQQIFNRDLLMDQAKITRYGSNVEDFSFHEIYDIVFAMAVLAGWKKSEVEWYAQFPLPAEMFGLWHEAMSLFKGDVETTKKA